MLTDDTPFADIICNILGVMIILTSLGSLTPFLRDADERPDDMQDPSPEQPYRVPRWQMLPPFSTYYIVEARGVAELDLTPVARMLAENTDMLKGQAGGIDYELEDRWYFHKAGLRESGRWQEWDFDAYSLKVQPDLPSLLERTAAPQTASALSGHVADRNRAGGRSATFLVYASGMDRFVPIHRSLTEGRIQFRWIALPDGSPITFVRSATQDESYEYRR